MIETINSRHEVAVAEAESRTPMKAWVSDHGIRVDFVPDLKSTDMLRFCGWHWERQIAQGSHYWAQMAADFGHHGVVPKGAR